MRFYQRKISQNSTFADINECEVGGANVGPCDSYCTNTEGSYICKCDAGYNSTGVLCTGILIV